MLRSWYLRFMIYKFENHQFGTSNESVSNGIHFIISIINETAFILKTNLVDPRFSKT